MSNINWAGIQVFIGGRPIADVNAITYTNKFGRVTETVVLRKAYRRKGVSVTKRLRTVAEIVLAKSNLN